MNIKSAFKLFIIFVIILVFFTILSLVIKQNKVLQYQNQQNIEIIHSLYYTIEQMQNEE